MREIKQLMFLLLYGLPGLALAAGFTDSVCNVATSSTECAAADGAQTWLLLQNDSDTTVYCRVGATAALNQGIRLDANGGATWWDVEPTVTKVAVNCIHGGSGVKKIFVNKKN